MGKLHLKNPKRKPGNIPSICVVAGMNFVSNIGEVINFVSHLILMAAQNILFCAYRVSFVAPYLMLLAK